MLFVLLVYPLEVNLKWSVPLGNATAVAAHGDTVAVAIGSQLSLMQMGDSLADLVTVANYQAPGRITFMRALSADTYAVVVDDTLLYLFYPSQEAFSTTYFADSDTTILDVVKAGDHLYIASKNLYVVSTSDLANPVGVWVPPTGEATGVDLISDTTLAVACRSGGLKVLLISVPSYPIEIGSQSSYNIGRVRVAHVGDSVYAYGLRDGSYVGYDIYWYNVTEPTSPIYRGYSRGYTYSSPITDMLLDTAGRTILASCNPNSGYGVELWRIRDNGSPQYMNRITISYVKTMAISPKRRAVFVTIHTGGSAGMLYGYTYKMPVSRMTYNSPGTVKDVAGYGNYFYGADGDRGFFVLQLNYEWNWSFYDSMDVAGVVSGLAVDYPILFVGAGTDGIYAYNTVLKDTVGHINPGGNVLKLALSGSTLLAASLISDMFVVDVSDPTNMQPVATYAGSGGAAVDVAAEGSVAYLALGSGGVDVVDISDPSNPTLLTNIPTQGYANGVSVKDGVLYVASGVGFGGLEIYDVSNPSSPSALGGVAFGPATSIGGPVETQGRKYVYLTLGNDFYVVDVTDPNAPFVQARRTTSYQANAVGAPLYKPNYVLLANDINGLVLWNWEPTWDNTNRVSKDMRGVVVSTTPTPDGSLLLAFDTLSGTRVFDISDSLPAELSRFGYRPRYGVSNGQLAFVVQNRNNIVVYDISDPTSPTRTDSVYVGNYLHKIALCHDSVLAVVYNQTIRFYALVDDTIAYRSNINMGDTTRDLWFDGSYLWATAGSGLYAIDAVNPTNATVVGLFTGLNDPKEVVVYDTLAFLADRFGTDTLRVVDITPLYLMSQVTAYDAMDAYTTLWFSPVDTSGDGDTLNLLYAIGQTGVSLFNADNYASGLLSDTMGYYPLPATPWNASVSGDGTEIYVPMGDQGIMALIIKTGTPTGVQETGPGVVLLSGGLGNPGVRFTLSQPTRVKIRVYSVAGARVAEPANRMFGPGAHTVPLPGQLPKGVYLVRVEIGGRALGLKWVKTQ